MRVCLGFLGFVVDVSVEWILCWWGFGRGCDWILPVSML